MYRNIVLLLLLVAVLAACAVTAPPPVEFAPPDRAIDYTSEVKPILKKRCVVCHSCYNSPCQLKMSSFMGLDRGASRKAVYNATRRTTMEPTRLFMDAQTTGEWRGRGFSSVTENSSTCGGNNSIMLRMLAHKNEHPVRSGEKYWAEDPDLICADSDERLGQYFKKHPNGGMPFGFPPLTREQFEVVAGWLVQGARGPDDSPVGLVDGQEGDESVIPPADAERIALWEEFFNREDSKHRMTARYLYEHLFLAHIYFDTDSGEFYELVRSKTGPGKPIRIIATDLPYDAPGPDVERVYYRFRKITSIIVHKTHITFRLGNEEYDKYRQLFIDRKWLNEPVQVRDYSDPSNANPFVVYEQMPPDARYRFLLDNIHYVIMTFIRGPVCKGQVALDVIRDHFWLLFLDPKYDIAVQRPGFIYAHRNLLEMPTMKDSSWRLFESILKREYRKKATRFTKVRQDTYERQYRYRELDQRAIWPGEENDDTPLLTVFRHFDSASVHAGALGPLPRTVWVMDYPLVERIYYSLVAGFNVFGSQFHQLSIRVYMDELRQEGETYFIDFMPKEKRRQMMQEWYGDMDIDKWKIQYTMSGLEAGFPFSGAMDPKREFIEYLVDSYFPGEMGISFDENYLRAGEHSPEFPEQYQEPEEYIQGFRAVASAETSFYNKVADHNANLAYIRIRVNDNESDDIYLSMIINRWHEDVTTMFNEEDRLRPEKDTAVFVRGFVGSYPNYFFEVSKEDIPAFLTLLRDFNGTKEHFTALNRWGVNRMQPDFWQVYDRFQERFDASDAVTSGLFDLNRYYKVTLEDPQ